MRDTPAAAVQGTRGAWTAAQPPVGTLLRVPATLDAVLLRGWCTAAVQALERNCAEIDRINVFPVADRDTGTNLLLTMRAAADAVRRCLRESGEPPSAGPVASAL